MLFSFHFFYWLYKDPAVLTRSLLSPWTQLAMARLHGQKPKRRASLSLHQLLHSLLWDMGLLLNFGHWLRLWEETFDSFYFFSLHGAAGFGVFNGTR